MRALNREFEAEIGEINLPPANNNNDVIALARKMNQQPALTEKRGRRGRRRGREVN